MRQSDLYRIIGQNGAIAVLPDSLFPRFRVYKSDAGLINMTQKVIMRWILKTRRL